MSLTPSIPARFLQADLPFSRPPTPGAQDKIRVGWVGLGIMGRIMARNLALRPSTRPAVSLPLIVWNRSKDKADALAAELGESKIVVAQTLEDVAKQCDVIITSLANDAAVSAVYKQMIEALKVRYSECIVFTVVLLGRLQSYPPMKTKIFVETSTVRWHDVHFSQHD